MIEGLFRNDNYQIARQLLDASVLRHQAIASNIANAETPGYKRVDLAPNFSARLQMAVLRGKPASSVPAPTLAEDSSAKSMGENGNNVEIEKELLYLNRNNTEHNFLAQIVNSNLRSLRTAITGRSAG